MEQNNLSVKQLKQRNFLLMLPVLTLPFVTFLFWALGVGKFNAASGLLNAQAGLNLRLPDAKFHEGKPFDKLSFYEQAAQDSDRTKEAQSLDPYWNHSSADTGQRTGTNGILQFRNNNDLLPADEGVEANKKKVYDKLNELKNALNQAKERDSYSQESANHSYSAPPPSSAADDVERLQAMMQKTKQDKTEDPEITQLNDMLDKIKAIQHPEQVNDTGSKAVNKRLALITAKQNISVSLLSTESDTGINRESLDTTVSGNGFYSSTGFGNDNETLNSNAIEAVIPETQTIVAGATIKLELSGDAMIEAVLLPAGTFIYGTASLSNERLKIDISFIRFQNSILPVSLDVFDMDGQEGICMPGSIDRTVAKESANNAIGGINATDINPTIGTQAATAGIEAAKTLLSRKARLVKMTVPAGYKVLLKDSH